jgi:hypothetical protein
MNTLSLPRDRSLSKKAQFGEDRLPERTTWTKKRAKLTISAIDRVEYYRDADWAPYTETNLVRAVHGLQSEGEREVHVHHGTSLGQDTLRPGSRGHQGSAT